MSGNPKSRSARARKKLGIPEPILEFKVRMEPWDRKSMTWTVKIFSTDYRMERYLDFIRPDKHHHTEDYAFTDNLSQTVAFCLWTMTDNCVAHEAYHMAAWWALQKRFIRSRCIEWNSRNHERMAEAVGNLTSQIWEHFAKQYPRTECHGWPKSS